VRRRYQSGVTIVEMMVVVAIIGLIAAISFPAVGAGLDSIRLVSATDAITAFLNSGLNRAERRQVAVEIDVSSVSNTITMQSAEPGFVRSLPMPEGVTIVGVHPRIPGVEDRGRRFYLFPGGAVPRIGVEVANRRGARRIVRVDPVTGVAQVETPGEQ